MKAEPGNGPEHLPCDFYSPFKPFATEMQGQQGPHGDQRVIGVTEEEFDSQNVCGIQAFPCTELYIL